MPFLSGVPESSGSPLEGQGDPLLTLQEDLPLPGAAAPVSSRGHCQRWTCHYLSGLQGPHPRESRNLPRREEGAMPQVRGGHGMPTLRSWFCPSP